MNLINTFGKSYSTGEKGPMCKLLGMKILSMLVLLLFSVLVVIALLPSVKIPYRVKLIIDCIMSLLLIVTYTYWLCVVFKLMRELRAKSV